MFKQVVDIAKFLRPVAAAAVGAQAAWTASAGAAPENCKHQQQSTLNTKNKVHVLNSQAARVLFTKMRNKSTDCKEFVHYADRLMRILAEEGFAVLPAVQPIDIETPCGTYHGLSGVDSSKIAAVSIVRAGDSLLQAVRDIEPGVQVGKILIQRDESDPLKRPKLIYVKLPRDIRNQTVILVDPMLATGGSAGKAIQVLKDRGVPEENILFLNVVACPEGIEYLTKAFPAITILTAEVDERLNEHKYIVPGLGDYGDRYFGTEE